MAKTYKKYACNDFMDIGLKLGMELKKKYRIDTYLAMGHVNLVYTGTDLENKRKVLIKEFCPYQYANRDLDGKQVICKGNAYKKEFEKARAMFEQECKIHIHMTEFPEKMRKNIVKYIENFEENSTKYLILSYIPGQDLYHYMRNHHHISFTIMAKKILNAVQQIHAVGVIHKDIKPTNIIVSEDKEVYIIDFGTADLIEQKEKMEPFVSKSFSAPELYEGKEVTIQADTYSLGAVFYYLLTGLYIQNAEERKKEDKVDNISKYCMIPWILEWAIMKSIKMDPKKRLKRMWILNLLLQ